MHGESLATPAPRCQSSGIPAFNREWLNLFGSRPQQTAAQ